MKLENRLARAAGISKAFRQYAKRYGSGVQALIQEHKKNPVPILDNGRDRREKANAAQAHN